MRATASNAYNGACILSYRQNTQNRCVIGSLETPSLMPMIFGCRCKSCMYKSSLCIFRSIGISENSLRATIYLLSSSYHHEWLLTIGRSGRSAFLAKNEILSLAERLIIASSWKHMIQILICKTCGDGSVTIEGKEAWQ